MTDFRRSSEIRELSTHIRQLWVEEYREFELKTTGISTGWGSKHMSKWDGGVDARGTSRNSEWYKIAEFCIERDLQSEELVAAMFYNEYYPPKPNQAHGLQALKKYIAYRTPATQDEIKKNILNSFETQKSYTAANIKRLCQYGGKTEDVAIREIALTPTNVLTQLFRYCVLKNLNRPIAEDYAEVALRQYKRHSDIYDEVWADWIPEELRNKIRKSEEVIT